MKITNEGLEFATTGTEPLKMVCTATLPTVLAAVTEPPDISKEPASTSPKCDFTNAELFTTQGPAQPGGNAQAATQPAAANSPSGGAPAQSVQFLIHAEPDDQSGRTQSKRYRLAHRYHRPTRTIRRSIGQTSSAMSKPEELPTARTHSPPVYSAQ